MQEGLLPCQVLVDAAPCGLLRTREQTDDLLRHSASELGTLVLRTGAE